eukprot:TRINITY_DN7658_c1_g2_i1.p1 TRINITY_DN7658_c1_g2~~TRINITY_DN7658_c1_g2_i1.p1  ORF type:complete len:1234 (+),score=290.06 TRINITY_DN7658_c1_g2_i1:1014-4715(+)
MSEEKATPIHHNDVKDRLERVTNHVAQTPEGTVRVAINGQQVRVPRDVTVWEACRRAGVSVPTLCFHPRLPSVGKCKVCVVEVVNDDVPFKLSCSTKVKDGMIVVTNSPAVKSKANAALADRLVQAPAVTMQNVMKPFFNPEIEDLGQWAKEALIDDSSPAVYRDMSKCIGCTRCVRACSNLQGMDILEENSQSTAFEPKIRTQFSLPLDLTDCIECGQCAVFCPTGAIVERDDTPLVRKAMASGKIMVVQTAPSIRVAVSELFGKPPGTMSAGKLVAAAKALGFHYVFDTTFAADLTIIEEGNELLRRLERVFTSDVAQEEKQTLLPMFTSCCPGWVNVVEKLYPELIPHLSTCKSPQDMLGSLIKGFWAKTMNLDAEEIYSVSVMPCTAKKGNIKRKQFRLPNGKQIIDCVITTREFGKLLKGKGIGDFDVLPSMEFDNPLGASSGAGILFGATGGVMEAALRTAFEVKTGKTLPRLQFDALRGLQAVKVAEVDMNGLILRAGVVHGMKNARQLLKQIQSGQIPQFHFIEVMACQGGCIGGGGQPRSIDPNIIPRRMSAVYSMDEKSVVRKSHENPYIQKLYAEYLGEPLGDLSHELLHTNYTDRSKSYGANAPCMMGRKTPKRDASVQGLSLSADAILLLFGSQSGNAKKAAETLGEEISATVKGSKVSIAHLDSISDISSFSKSPPKALIAITSTFAEGEFPDNAKQFWGIVSSSEMPKDSMKGTKIAVFGLGSSSYGPTQFCKAGKQLHERFIALGAEPLLDLGFGDDQAPEGFHSGFDPWSKSLLGKLGSTGFALHDPPMPAYRISLALPTRGVDDLTRHPPPGYHFVYLKDVEVLTAPGYDREVRRFVWDIGGSTLNYEVGDHVGIMPRNSVAKVEDVLTLLNLEGSTLISINPTDPKKSAQSQMPFPATLTVRELFKQYLDIQSRPTRKFFESLLPFCADAIERRMLRRLSSDDLEDSKVFEEFTGEYDYVDALSQFRSAIPPVQNLISQIPFIQPRWYSIASAPRPDSGRLETVIVVDRWKTPKKRTKTGLCTGFLFALEAQRKPKVAIMIREGILQLRAGPRPIVMFGLGTGLAPFFGILQHRMHLYLEAGKHDPTKLLGPACLFVGVRHEKKDFIQREFIEQCISSGVLNVLVTAFSHDQDHFIFVQDRIREFPEKVWNMISNPLAVVYYCGPAMGGPTNVPEEITRAVMYCIVKCGKFTEKQAAKFIETMKAEGRFQFEAF